MSSSKAIKRKASSEIIGRPSQYHASVTLYDTSIIASGSTPALRRSKRVKVKEEAETELLLVDPRDVISDVVKVEAVEVKQGDIPAKKTRKAASPRKPKSIPQSLAVPHPAPPHWKEVYDTIKTMRESIVAPVDTMGCHRAQLAETDLKVCAFYQYIPLM